MLEIILFFNSSKFGVCVYIYKTKKLIVISSLNFLEKDKKKLLDIDNIDTLCDVLPTVF